MWLLIAGAAARKLPHSSKAAFYERKLALATYWFEREMPMIPALRQRVESGSACLMGLAAEVF